MKVLVTGGGGFLGKILCKKLLEKGWEVAAAGRSEHPELVAAGVEFIRGDLRDRDFALKVCRGRDIVFHCAAKPGIWGRRSEFRGSNLETTTSVIEACRTGKVPKLVFTSSTSVVFDGKPHCGDDESLPYPSSYLLPYARYKAMAEKAVREFSGGGTAVISLRPHLVWGPGDPYLIPNIIRRARAGKLKIIGPGTNKVSMIFVDDAADAHIAAAEALEPGSPLDGNVYFIVSDEPVNLWDFINKITVGLGLSPARTRVSARAAYFTGAVLELACGLFGIRSEPTMTRFLAQQLSLDHYYSNAAAVRDFGFKTGTSIEAGLEKTIAWLKSHYLPTAES